MIKLPIMWYLLLVLSIVSVSSQAHPDLEIRINLATKMIASESKNAQLYLQRGELYRQHQAWQAALNDYHKATELGLAKARVDFHIARLYRDTKKINQAQVLLLQSLKTAVDKNLTAMINLNLAEIYADKKLWLQAAEHFYTTITTLEKAEPALYFACADAYSKAGGSYFDKAIEVITAGINKNSGVISLYTLAIEIETTRENYLAAIGWTKKLLLKYPKFKKYQKRLLHLKKLSKTDENFKHK